MKEQVVKRRILEEMGEYLCKLLDSGLKVTIDHFLEMNFEKSRGQIMEG